MRSTTTLLIDNKHTASPCYYASDDWPRNERVREREKERERERRIKRDGREKERERGRESESEMQISYIYTYIIKETDVNYIRMYGGF